MVTVANLIRTLSEAHDLNAEVQVRIGYTFYEKDEKVRNALNKRLTPSCGITHAMDGTVILDALQLEDS